REPASLAVGFVEFDQPGAVRAEPELGDAWKQNGDWRASVGWQRHDEIRLQIKTKAKQLFAGGRPQPASVRLQDRRTVQTQGVGAHLELARVQLNWQAELFPAIVRLPTGEDRHEGVLVVAAETALHWPVRVGLKNPQRRLPGLRAQVVKRQPHLVLIVE